MDSEGLHSKERLAVERKAQPLKALACVSLVGVAGVLAIVLPWSAAVGSGRGPGELPMLARKTPSAPLLPAGPAAVSPGADPHAPRPAASPDGHGLASAQTSGGVS